MMSVNSQNQDLYLINKKKNTKRWVKGRTETKEDN